MGNRKRNISREIDDLSRRLTYASPVLAKKLTGKLVRLKTKWLTDPRFNTPKGE